MKSKTEQDSADYPPAVAAEKELRRDLRRGSFKGDYILPPSEKPNPFLPLTQRKFSDILIAERAKTMTTITDYAPGEVSRLGEAIYQERLKAGLELGNVGRVLVIEVATGNYEFQEPRNRYEASDRLRERNPNAVLYALRIGYPAVTKRGAWPAKR